MTASPSPPMSSTAAGATVPSGPPPPSPPRPLSPRSTSKLAKTTDEILVVSTLSSKMSGTYQSATGRQVDDQEELPHRSHRFRDGRHGPWPDRDSPPPRSAKGRPSSQNWWSSCTRPIPRSHFIAYFDTLKYLAKGGRIGKAQGLLRSLAFGEAHCSPSERAKWPPLTRVRSLGAGMDYLYNFVTGFGDRIEEMAVEHTTAPDEADRLAARWPRLYPETGSAVPRSARCWAHTEVPAQWR